MAVISQAVVMISLLCERRALLTEFHSTTYLSFWECPTQRQQLHECLEKECILFSQRSELQVQEGKWSVVPLRTSDCETIFSFLFLRGLEETPVTGAKGCGENTLEQNQESHLPLLPLPPDSDLLLLP